MTTVSSTAMYRLGHVLRSTSHTMNVAPAVISSSTISRLVNCSKKSSHLGMEGGGVSTLGPYRSSSSAAFCEPRPWLLLGSSTSMCVSYFSASTSSGYMCSLKAPAAPLPPLRSRASSAFMMGAVSGTWTCGMMDGSEEFETRRCRAIRRSALLLLRRSTRTVPSVSRTRTLLLVLLATDTLPALPLRIAVIVPGPILSTSLTFSDVEIKWCVTSDFPGSTEILSTVIEILSFSMPPFVSSSLDI
mmetsp:Transcript_23501/g.32170  ORF Transcript_23501/g.32170 Transcript_23501/m.32170 type:complete len:245 (-) Transcript_23501:2983-3717(-)